MGEIGLLISYLVGSCPFGVWLGKWMKQTDVRNHGSGNSGATNNFRVLGRRIGIFVLVLDVIKGWLPVYVAMQTDTFHPLLFGLAAVLGHCFPIWVGFRGGKGVATGAGAFLAFSPLFAGIGVLSMLVTLGIFRMVSLASAVGCIIVAAVSYIVSPQTGWIATVITVFILYRHHSNFVRIWNQTEPKLGHKKEVE